MMRKLTAHEVLRLTPTLPGSEVRTFYEPSSRAVQVLFVGAMMAHDLDHWEFGLSFRLTPALVGLYEPACLVDYPSFRWEGPVARAFGNRLGAVIRAWAIEAYEAHLSDQEFYCQTMLRQPDLANGDQVMRTLEKLWEVRRVFRGLAGTE